MSKVKEFYRGKIIFVTGGSGFLGKVLVEKILYSCSEIEKMYFLIRVKNDESIDVRMKKLLDCPIFKRIKLEKPEVLQKIIPIKGDIGSENLGISNEDLLKILDTNILFNLAASVTFNDKVEVAFVKNCVSLKILIEIAKKMKNLEVFMQCSTGYCFPGVSKIEEKIYDLEFDSQLITCENNEKYLKTAEQNKFYGHPSTYSFTKRCAEFVANKEFKNLPLCIVRPTIGKFSQLKIR